MTSLRHLLLLLTCALVLPARHALAADAWVEGQHYFLIASPPPSTLAPGTPSVAEVFSYGCPACASFFPYMEALVKRLPKGVAVEYVPASWNPSEDWPVFQRAYLAAKALGISEKAHAAVFKSVSSGGELAVVDARTGRLRSPLPSLGDVAQFYARTTGVSASAFMDAARSFSVESAIPSTDARIRAFQADQTPTLIINNKYRLNPASAGGAQQAVELALWLLAKDGKRAR